MSFTEDPSNLLSREVQLYWLLWKYVRTLHKVLAVSWRKRWSEFCEKI